MEMLAIQGIEITDDDRMGRMSIELVEPFLEGLHAPLRTVALHWHLCVCFEFCRGWPESPA